MKRNKGILLMLMIILFSMFATITVEAKKPRIPGIPPVEKKGWQDIISGSFREEGPMNYDEFQRANPEFKDITKEEYIQHSKNFSSNKDPNSHLSHVDYGAVNKKTHLFTKRIMYYTGVLIGITLIISVGVLTFHFLKLGTAYNHPLHRRKIFQDIGVVLLGLVLLGGIGFVINLLVARWMY